MSSGATVRYYDISLNLSSETVRWVAAPALEFVERRRINRGDATNASAVTMSVHSGRTWTRPFTLFQTARPSTCCRSRCSSAPPWCTRWTPNAIITEQHVNAIELGGVTRVLFKTRNSNLLRQPTYDPDFVAFSWGQRAPSWIAAFAWLVSTISRWRMRTNRYRCTAVPRPRCDPPRRHRPAGDRARALRADLFSSPPARLGRCAVSRRAARSDLIVDLAFTVRAGRSGGRRGTCSEPDPGRGCPAQGCRPPPRYRRPGPGPDGPSGGSRRTAPPAPW